MDVKCLRIITREFNRYRAPECRAVALLNRDDCLVIEFSGTKVAEACCFDENFIDYQYYLKDFVGSDFEISGIKRPSSERFVVMYKLKH